MNRCVVAVLVGLLLIACGESLESLDETLESLRVPSRSRWGWRGMRVTTVALLFLVACGTSPDTLTGEALNGRPTAVGYSYDIQVVNTGDDQETGTCVVSVADNDGNSEVDHVNFVGVQPGATEVQPISLDIAWEPDAVAVDCDGDGEPDG